MYLYVFSSPTDCRGNSTTVTHRHRPPMFKPTTPIIKKYKSTLENSPAMFHSSFRDDQANVSNYETSFCDNLDINVNEASDCDRSFSIGPKNLLSVSFPFAKNYFLVTII